MVEDAEVPHLARDPETGMSVADVVALLDLRPLPREGARFRRTYLDVHASAIYFVLSDADVSRLHRNDRAEVWHHYLGAPARVLLLHADGTHDDVVMGSDLRAGQRPQLVVPAGSWMGATTSGTVTLMGTTMSPPFDGGGFELGDPASLIAAYPAARGRIEALTAANEAR